MSDASGAVRLGFISLVDCAPLPVALEKGFFAAEGLDVSLVREVSWATVRDKVAVGALHGAHMLAPLAIAASLGIGSAPAPMLAPMGLNQNGAAMVVSAALADALAAVEADARTGLAGRMVRVIAQRRAAKAPPLIFGVVFPYSIHTYLVRHWLAEAGIDPDKDVRLTVVPPSRMAGQLRTGGLDGFCVGAPWPAVAVSEGAGRLVAQVSSIWRPGPDKVFGVGAGWAEREPERLQAALRALLRASAWADDAGNAAELAGLLARPEYVDAPEGDIARSLGVGATGGFDRIRFGPAASVPAPDHAAWFLSQMLRWGQVEPAPGLAEAARAVYRPDLFAAAAEGAGIAVPTRPMPFFDSESFDPAAPEVHAADFPISRLRRSHPV